MPGDRLREEREFAFDVDNQSMLRKVKKHLLADSLDYVKELVQMSVEGHASKIEVGCSPWRFSIEDNGEGITKEEIEDLLSRLFVAESSHKRYEGLAPAVITALENGADRVTIESRHDGGSVKFTIDDKLEMLFEESRRKEKGTRITVSRPLTKNMLYSKERRKANEEGKVRKECTLVPADIRLNGELLNPDKKMSGVLAQVETRDEDGTRLLIGLPLKNDIFGTIEVFYLKNGIAYGRELRCVDVPLKVVVDSPRFRLNLSRNQIVQDEGQEAWVHDTIASHLDELYLALLDRIPELRKPIDKTYFYRGVEYSAFRVAQDYLLSYIKNRLKYNKYNHQEKRVERTSAVSEEMLAKVLDAPLFTSCKRKPLTLADLVKTCEKRGYVPYQPYANSWFNPFLGLDELAEEAVLAFDSQEWHFLDHFFYYANSLKDIHEENRVQQRRIPQRNRERERFERSTEPEWRKALRSFGDGIAEYIFSPIKQYVLSPAGRGIAAAAKGVGIAGLAVGSAVGAVVAAPFMFAGKGMVKGSEYLAERWYDYWSHRKELHSTHRTEKRKRLEKLTWEEQARFAKRINEFLKRPEVLEFLPRVGVSVDSVGMPRCVVAEHDDYIEGNKRGPIYIRWEHVYPKKEKAEKRPLLVFDEKHRFTKELMASVTAQHVFGDDGRFDYALFPVLMAQLMRNRERDENDQNYMGFWNQGRYLNEVLEHGQGTQIDLLMAGIVNDLVGRYSASDEKGFRQGYEPLGEHLRRGVIAAVYECGKTSPSIDAYLSKVDGALVEEIGSGRIKEQQEEKR